MTGEEREAIRADVEHCAARLMAQDVFRVDDVAALLEEIDRRVEVARIEAACRMLLDSGDLTPMGARVLESLGVS